MTTDGGTEKNLCLLSYLSTRWKRQGFPKHWKSVANCNFGMLLALLKRKAAIKAIPNVQEISPNHLSSFPVKRMNEVSYHPAGFYKRRLYFFAPAVVIGCCRAFHNRHGMNNSPLPNVPKTLTFKMRPSAQPFFEKKSFICMRMRNHLHMKGEALKPRFDTEARGNCLLCAKVTNIMVKRWRAVIMSFKCEAFPVAQHSPV